MNGDLKRVSTRSSDAVKKSTGNRDATQDASSSVTRVDGPGAEEDVAILRRRLGSLVLHLFVLLYAVKKFF